LVSTVSNTYCTRVHRAVTPVTRIATQSLKRRRPRSTRACVREKGRERWKHCCSFGIRASGFWAIIPGAGEGAKSIVGRAESRLRISNRLCADHYRWSPEFWSEGQPNQGHLWYARDTCSFEVNGTSFWVEYDGSAEGRTLALRHQDVAK
jgi:hypothetical protein